MKAIINSLRCGMCRAAMMVICSPDSFPYVYCINSGCPEVNKHYKAPTVELEPFEQNVAENLLR